MLGAMLPDTNARPDDNTLARLYPNLTGSDLQEAEENFARYLDVALRIWTRIEADPEALQRLRELTRQHSRRYDDREQSNLASSHSHP